MVGAFSYNNLQMWKKPYKYLSMLCKFIQNGHVDDTWVPGGHASVNLHARWTCQCARDAAMSFCRKPPGFFQSHRQVNPQIEARIPNPSSLLRRHGGGRRLGDVVLVGFLRSWVPSSQRQEGEPALLVAGSVSAEPHDVRAAGVLRLRLRAAAEGAEMDLLEPSKSRQEVLRLP